MPAVDSSAIRAIDYDTAARRLEILFVTGRLYAYADVPPHIYADMLASPSKGEYFNAHIRDRYAFARVGGRD
jgi:hypothetical protein